MDELIKQILLLHEMDRRKLIEIISASIEPLDEGYAFFENDFSEETLAIIKERSDDIDNERSCLIEFDDHISTIIRHAVHS